MLINIITNGLLLTPEVVDRLDAVRPERHQDHARRRPRHAQPHAAAARRPGHVRQDPQQHPPGRRQVPDLDRRQLRRVLASTATRRCSTSCASRTSPTSWRRSPSSRSSASRSRSSPKGFIPLTAVGSARQAAERHLHDVGGRRRDTGDEHLRLVPLPRRQDVVPARRDDQARIQDRRRRAHGPVRDPQAARPHDRPRGLALRLPGVCGQRRRSRPATSTDGRKSGGAPRRSASRRSPRGRTATTARSSPCVRAGARPPHTPSSAT